MDRLGIANAVVQQADGKLILAGIDVVNDNGESDFIVVRLTGNGTPDAAFGISGVARVDFAGLDDNAVAVVEQPDGKLVVAGTTWDFNGVGDFALVRLNIDGTLDATFGAAGRATLDMGNGNDFASDLVRQPDGKLVIAGGSNATGLYRLVFARFNTDGSPDASFGNGGTTVVDFGGGSHSWATAVAQQADGKLVATGPIVGVGTQDIALVRITADGMLDASFDGDGMLAVDFGDLEYASSIALQSNGAIVVAGITGNFSIPAKSALLRVNADGSVDNTFGAAGQASHDFGNEIGLNDIVVQADGKLVATGMLNTSFQGQDMILVRFNADGSLDTAYGNGGVAIADFGGTGPAPLSYGVALVRQVDGKLVSAGSANGNARLAAARFDENAAFPGAIGFAGTWQRVNETAGTVNFVVRRTGGRTGAVSVNYAAAAGAAQAGSDYVNAPGMLTWNDGEMGEKTISVDLIDDTLPEQPEDFFLNLSAPTGGARLAASQATAFIASDDGGGELRFYFARDALFVTERNGTVSVPVARLNGWTGTVSVHYETVSGTAVAGADFAATSGTLTWADGDTDVKIIDVEFFDDSDVEIVEGLQIRLSQPTGGATIGTRDQDLEIEDNDPGLVLARTGVTIGEAAGSVLLSVVRSGAPVGAVSVDYATSSGTATAGTDFTDASGTLNWADGDSADKTIAVSLANDSVIESDETFKLTLSNPSAGTALGSNSTATVTITDDDVPSGGGGSSGGGGGGGGAVGWFDALYLVFILAFRLNPFGANRRRRELSRRGHHCPRPW